MAFKQTLNMTTEHALTTNLAYFFNFFCLSEEMKDKCIASIQKQIIMKTIIWRRESYKTSGQIWKDSRGMFVASPSASRLADSRRTSKPGVSLRIPSECKKIRTRKTPNRDTFHAVWW